MSETALNSELARSLGNVGGEMGGWKPRIEQLKTEITGDAPNTTNVLLAGFAECRVALGSDYPVYLSAATEYAQDASRYDFDPSQLITSVGAPLSHEKTAGAISREKYGALWFLMLLVLLMMLLTGCTPGRVEANGQTDTPDTAKPTVGPGVTGVAPTEMVAASPTATQMEPTIASTDTPVPTATLEQTNTPALSGEQLLEIEATEAGIPIEAANQFGQIEHDSTGLWHLNGNIDESDMQLNTGIVAGEITIGATTKLHYVNAAGQADWVYIPAISFNMSEGTTVVGANMVNKDGAALASRLTGDTSKVQEFITRYFQKMGNVSSISFGFPGSGHQDIITDGFFDSAISELYTQEMIEEFMRTGDSSLLPNRLLIPVDIAPNSALASN